ncbi:MAG: hypothetical protein WCH98_19780, partial [Verrucomicrobiota bacterium]
TSEGIQNAADAGQKLADYSARILQDPAVKKAAAGNSDAVEMRFSPDGSVCIETSDGRQTTVTLNGDAKEAAQKASLVLGSLPTAGRSGSASPGPTSKPLAPGIKIMPGTGSASILP